MCIVCCLYIIQLFCYSALKSIIPHLTLPICDLAEHLTRQLTLNVKEALRWTLNIGYTRKRSESFVKHFSLLLFHSFACSVFLGIVFLPTSFFRSLPSLSFLLRIILMYQHLSPPSPPPPFFFSPHLSRKYSSPIPSCIYLLPPSRLIICSVSFRSLPQLCLFSFPFHNKLILLVVYNLNWWGAEASTLIKKTRVSLLEITGQWRPAKAGIIKLGDMSFHFLHLNTCTLDKKKKGGGGGYEGRGVGLEWGKVECKGGVSVRFHVKIQLLQLNYSCSLRAPSLMKKN